MIMTLRSIQPAAKLIATGVTVLVLATTVLSARVASAAAVLPDFSQATFVPGAPIDNPYFPLTPGTVYRYSADVVDPDDPAESEFLEIEDFVTFQTQTVNGVQTRVRRAREWKDGLLVEDTNDFFAQDTAGNVWYLGEDTVAFEYDDEGNQIGSSTEGSWRAGVNGASAGFIMPADLQIGFNHFQEFAPNDDAVDQATILSVSESVTVPAGSFDNVLKVLEFTELEPGKFEHKLYAPGVGLVQIEEDLDEQRVPLNIIPLQSVAVIPLPAAFAPGLAGLALAAGCAMRGRWSLGHRTSRR
jgi:hypothetical protein